LPDGSRQFNRKAAIVAGALTALHCRSPYKGSASCTPPEPSTSLANDAISEAQHISPRVNPVAVDWVPSRAKLAARVPAAQRRQAHSEELGGLADRKQLRWFEPSRRRHRIRLSNVDHAVNGA
jgi:hypothetical protein